MTVEAQVRMVASLFKTLHIVDEGLDPIRYIPERDAPSKNCPVRGKPGGMLGAVLVTYEDLKL